MLTVRTTGSIASLIEQAKALHGGVVPYAAATALTRTAHALRTEALPQHMRAIFANPRPYVLNGLFVRAASADNLSATIAVKNTAGGSSTVVENILAPEAQGGPRKPKRVERALHALGILRVNEFAMPGRGVPEAEFESGPWVRRLIAQVQATWQRGPTRRGAGGGSRAGSAFFAEVGRSRTRGIWKRDGRGLRALLIFTRAPVYRPRLDYESVAERAAQQVFPGEFAKALSQQLARAR